MSKVWNCVLALAAAGCASNDEAQPPAEAEVEAVESSAMAMSAWAVGETNGAGTPATWSAFAGEVDYERVVSENTGQTYNLLFFCAPKGPDLELSIRLKADAGEEDQGGGLFWRAQGPSDYYCARWNPLENNFRAYHVVGGVRTKLASLDVELDATAWHTLTVRAVGAQMRVAIDGRELVFDDATIAGAGQVGLWTKADACTTFSGWEARTLED